MEIFLSILLAPKDHMHMYVLRPCGPVFRTTPPHPQAHSSQLFLPSFPLVLSICLFLDPLRRRDSKCRRCPPITVVHAGIIAQKGLFARLVGQVATDLVAVFFGLEGGDEVDASPHFLAGEFTAVVVLEKALRRGGNRSRRKL